MSGARGRRRAAAWLAGLLLLAWGGAMARMLPGETLQQLPRPWPPPGWALTLDLPEQASPHQSEARRGSGYFGQTLYRQLGGTSDYWTANVLIQDRGGESSAWRAVSAVNCNSRMYHGLRARECIRGDRGYTTKTLHYQVGRFYVTIQLAGPGDTAYPRFELALDGASIPSRGPGDGPPGRGFWDF